MAICPTYEVPGYAMGFQSNIHQGKTNLVVTGWANSTCLQSTEWQYLSNQRRHS
jgi:hypothetical protein